VFVERRLRASLPAAAAAAGAAATTAALPAAESTRAVVCRAFFILRRRAADSARLRASVKSRSACRAALIAVVFAFFATTIAVFRQSFAMVGLLSSH
jgi:hypothetical protein